MQSAIIVQQYFHQNSVSGINIRADLSFFQSNAIYCDESYYSIYNTPILGIGKEYGQFQFENVIESYVKRNCMYKKLYQLISKIFIF